MFLFVVRHLRWLARVPLFPQVFDALLLAWTGLAHRQRIAAMEALETQALAISGVCLRVHRLGGVEFMCEARELGHVHGNGLLDVRLSRADAVAYLTVGDVHQHHVFPPASGWISFQLETTADVPRAMQLLQLSAARIGVHFQLQPASMAISK